MSPRTKTRESVYQVPDDTLPVKVRLCFAIGGELLILGEHGGQFSLRVAGAGSAIMGGRFAWLAGDLVYKG